MFSASNSSKVTAVCVVAMMMMMMMVMITDAAAMPKSAGHSKHPKTVPLQVDPDALVLTRTVRPLQNASISPWTYNVSHDDSLFPPMLSEARCLLRGCLDSEGKEDLSLESKPIMHQVLLLRKVESTHSYHYRLESRLIAVGCTCVRPSVQYQN